MPSTGSTPSPSRTGSSPLPIEQCTPEIQRSSHWVCLTAAIFTGTQLAINYTASFTPTAQANGFHIHVFTASLGDAGIIPPASVMGMQQQPESTQGNWWTDYQANVFTISADQPADSPPHHKLNQNDAFVCVRVATQTHGLVQDPNGGFRTGNCLRIAR